MGHDLADGLARFGNQVGAGLDLFHAGADQDLDLLRSLGAAACQVAHLAGHHGKAAAGFAGTRGFHGRVQRQDVGLERDAVDHTDDVADLAGAVVDLVHGGHHLANHLPASRSDFGIGSGHGAGLAGAFGALAHRAVDLLQAAGGLLQVAGGLLGAIGQVLVARGDLHAGGADALGAVAHFANEARQRCLHHAQRVHQRGQLVLALGLHRLRQIAFRDRCGQLLRQVQWLADALHVGQRGGDHHEHGQPHCHGKTDQGRAGRGFFLDPQAGGFAGNDGLDLLHVRFQRHEALVRAVEHAVGHGGAVVAPAAHVVDHRLHSAFVGGQVFLQILQHQVVLVRLALLHELDLRAHHLPGLAPVQVRLRQLLGRLILDHHLFFVPGQVGQPQAQARQRLGFLERVFHEFVADRLQVLHAPQACAPHAQQQRQHDADGANHAHPDGEQPHDWLQAHVRNSLIDSNLGALRRAPS